MDLIAQMSAALAPLLQFHAAQKGAHEDDVRFFWDIRVLRGADTEFAHVTGSSTLSGLLSPSQLHLAAEKVGDEMISKIAAPIAGKFQELVNQAALAVKEDDQMELLTAPVGAFPAPLESGDDLAVEAELISDQGHPPA